MSIRKLIVKKKMAKYFRYKSQTELLRFGFYNTVTIKLNSKILLFIKCQYALLKIIFSQMERMRLRAILILEYGKQQQLQNL